MKKKIIVIILFVLIIVLTLVIPKVLSTYSQRNTEPRVVEDSNGNIIIIGPGEGLSDEEYENIALKEKAEKFSKQKDSNKINDDIEVEVMSAEQEAEKNKNDEKAYEEEQKLLNVLYKYNSKESVDKIFEDVKKVNATSLVSSKNLPEEHVKKYELIVDTFEKNDLLEDDEKIIKDNLKKFSNYIKDSKYSNLQNRINNIVN